MSAGGRVRCRFRRSPIRPVPAVIRRRARYRRPGYWRNGPGPVAARPSRSRPVERRYRMRRRLRRRRRGACVRRTAQSHFPRSGHHVRGGEQVAGGVEHETGSRRRSVRAAHFHRHDARQHRRGDAGDSARTPRSRRGAGCPGQFRDIRTARPVHDERPATATDQSRLDNGDDDPPPPGWAVREARRWGEEIGR